MTKKTKQLLWVEVEINFIMLNKYFILLCILFFFSCNKSKNDIHVTYSTKYPDMLKGKKIEISYLRDGFQPRKSEFIVKDSMLYEVLYIKGFPSIPGDRIPLVRFTINISKTQSRSKIDYYKIIGLREGFKADNQLNGTWEYIIDKLRYNNGDLLLIKNGTGYNYRAFEYYLFDKNFILKDVYF